MNQSLAESYGFSLAGNESFEHLETMTSEQLTHYLLTQTNVIAAVERGDTPLDEAAAWIAQGVQPFFEGNQRTMRFSGAIWYLRARATTATGGN